MYVRTIYLLHFAIYLKVASTPTWCTYISWPAGELLFLVNTLQYWCSKLVWCSIQWLTIGSACGNTQYSKSLLRLHSSRCGDNGATYSQTVTPSSWNAHSQLKLIVHNSTLFQGSYSACHRLLMLFHKLALCRLSVVCGVACYRHPWTDCRTL